MKQTKVTSAPYIHVLDEAQLPLSPLSPKPLLNNILAMVVGSLLGIAMALLAEIWVGGSLSDESSILLPRIGGVPLLGALPAALPAPLTAGELPESAPGGSLSGATSAEDVLREIGYVLAHREGRGAVPVVLLTATRSDDTTAVVAAQLTATLVREGLRVTLVDADRLQPRLNRVFGAPDAPGLTDAITRRHGSLSDILHIGAGGRLRFLAAGSPSDTTPLTESNLRSVFNRLADPAETDLVVVSGPSVWSARLISPLERASSGMVLIAAEGSEGASPEESIARVRRVLTNGHQPRILGVVVGQGVAGALSIAPPPPSPAVSAPAGEIA